MATTEQAVHINITLPDGRETAIAFALPDPQLAGTVYVVGRVRGAGWLVLGVFSDKAEAESACTTPDDFVGPWTLNRRDTDELHQWEGQYFPHRSQS